MSNEDFLPQFPARAKTAAKKRDQQSRRAVNQANQRALDATKRATIFEERWLEVELKLAIALSVIKD